MYINRFLEDKINRYIKSREIIAILGPRQSGKTTLMRQIFQRLKNAKFISFEDREILELFVKDIKGFADLYIKETDFLFIDEFQYAKDGGKNLKFLYDEFNAKIIISGSSAPDLSVQSIKYLVGRIFVFNLYPLSFAEFIRFKDEKLYDLMQKDAISEQVIGLINKRYREFAAYGGYPRVAISETAKEKEEVLKSIYNTYFLKEIKEILQLADDFKLSKLIKILAVQSGGIANYNDLCSATGFTYLELLKNLNILKKTFISIECRPYFTNKKKEIVKAPKIYFLDLGFRNMVLGNFQLLDKRTDYGVINEGFVASEIYKKEVEPKYWRTKAGAEVDFIIEKNGKTIPIEVKSDSSKPKLTRSLINFIEEYKPKKSLILSNYMKKSTQDGTKILFWPLFKAGDIIS
jgi:predicted AAA+ superfamily ATPase